MFRFDAGAARGDGRFSFCLPRSSAHLFRVGVAVGRWLRRRDSGVIGVNPVFCATCYDPCVERVARLFFFLRRVFCSRSAFLVAAARMNEWRVLFSLFCVL